VQRAKGIGGSERHLLALLPALANRGVEVRMSVLRARGGDQFVDELHRSGIATRAWAAGPDVNPLTVGELGSEIHRFRPDVVHTHLIHGDLYGQLAAMAARVPGVSSVHGTPDFYRRQPYLAAGRLVGKIARRRIAISDYVASFLRTLRLAPENRIRVIPYGIDARLFRTSEPEAQAVRRSFGYSDREYVLGIASRLVPGKGHDLLLRAFGRAAHEYGTPRLLIAGDGPERQSLEALADGCCPPGTVRFLGFAANVRLVLAACDALAFPTQPELSEGFGLAALEAMAAGRPIIATAVGSLPEVVTHNVAGLLVPPASVEALRAAICSLAGDPELGRRLGDAGATRASTVFPLEAMVDKTLAVYEESA
jgi:glycosyltransferase involved in cell wall biosynthesis